MKYVNKEVVIVTFDVVIAITIGAITSYWISGSTSLLIGAISFFSIELIRFKLSTEKILEQYNLINSLINLLKPHDKVSELALLYGLRNLSKPTLESVWVPKDYVRDFWKDCVARAENKFSIISYVSPDELWNLKGWKEFLLTVQEERIKNDCKIERIFCIDSKSEKEMLKDVMLSQQKIGIEVGYVLKDELLSNKVVNEYYPDIRTLDIATIDDSWVLRTHLDNNRNIISASTTRDKEILRKVQFVFWEAKGIVKRDFVV